MSHDVTLASDLDRTRRTRRLIEGLLADPRQLGPDFQPVRRLSDRTVVAWKARGRGQAGSDVADTLALLAEAQSLGLVERLDWAFRCLAMDTAREAGVRALHLTPEPETFCTPCPPRLATSFVRGRSELAVAAELHDDAFHDVPRLRRAVDEFRDWGWTLVLAPSVDVSTCESALSWFRPDHVQLDLSDGPGSAADRRRLAAAAADSGAEIMALGVDSESDRDAAIAMGATTGRGRLLGAAGPLPAQL